MINGVPLSHGRKCEIQRTGIGENLLLMFDFNVLRLLSPSLSADWMWRNLNGMMELEEDASRGQTASESTALLDCDRHDS